MTRKRFSRNIIASNDAYKVHSHLNMLRENHSQNKEYFDYINKVSKVNKQSYFKRKYFVKFFGKLKEITELEANKLSPELLIIL